MEIMQIQHWEFEIYQQQIVQILNWKVATDHMEIVQILYLKSKIYKPQIVQILDWKVVNL